MATISELLNELRTLPLGNVYAKTISGKRYYYHQYFLHGKRYSVLVKPDELEDLRAQIEKRKGIEAQIKAMRSKDIVLSKSARELTGSVMNGNNVAAVFERGVLKEIHPEWAPLIIQRTHSLERFLQLRVIDMSRTNARILKRVLHIDVDEDYKASLFAYALSVGDQYWFKPKHSKLTYRSFAHGDDALFETALKGEVNVFYQKAKLSPEITTTGSFEKGWKFVDGEWWLYKKGETRQVFSELFSSAFATLIGVPTVSYELEGPYIRCRNFAAETNFEPIASLADDREDYDYLFALLGDLNPSFAKEYLRLIAFDAVVNNIDRHNENLGLLRDRANGEILSLAPNFDNNLALVVTNEVLNGNPKKDGFIRLFVSFLEKNPKAKETFLTLGFPDIDIGQIESIVASIPLEIPHKDEIASRVLIRYLYVKNLFNKQHN